MNNQNIEQLQGILAYAFSNGYTMDSKQDIEELAKYLNSRNVQVSDTVIFLGSRGCGKSLYIKNLFETDYDNIRKQAVIDFIGELLLYRNNTKLQKEFVYFEDIVKIANSMFECGIKKYNEKE